jgi:two-component system chemotaxis response regulator CheY
MKIISEKTEIAILRELEQIEKDAYGYRALWIKLSSIKNKNIKNLRDLITALSNVFLDLESKAFIFHDHDVIITYKGNTTLILDDAYKVITNITTENAQKITSVFDLEKAASIIRNICNKKIELEHLTKQAEKRSEEEALEEFKKDTSPLEISLDANLVNSLVSRKNENAQTKILLIEDDAFSRRLVKNILSKEYDVVEAESGKEALMEFLTYAPNIVFLDINLPDCTGMELLEKLISLDNKSYVVMLSGNAFKDNIVLSMQKGAKGFVAKPFPKDKIFHYLEKYNAEKSA